MHTDAYSGGLEQWNRKHLNRRTEHLNTLPREGLAEVYTNAGNCASMECA